MLTAEAALAWANMVAGTRATVNDVKRIAVALMQADREATERERRSAATEVEELARRLRTAADDVKMEQGRRRTE